MRYTVPTRFAALLMAILLIFCCSPVFVQASQPTGVTVCLHYDRPDGNYDGWSVWFWVEGKDAADVSLTEKDGEMTASFSVPEGATSVGFIVKQPNWAAKDVDKDQFVDVADFLSGTVHVRVASGKEGYEMTLGDDVVTGIKVKEVVYQEGTGVIAELTQPLTDAETAFSLNGAAGRLF